MSNGLRNITGKHWSAQQNKRVVIKTEQWGIGLWIIACLIMAQWLGYLPCYGSVVGLSAYHALSPECHVPALQIMKDRLGIRSESIEYSSNATSLKENFHTL